MSNYTEFSAELWNFLDAETDKHLQAHGAPHYAAFDADGTLWAADAGEVFFKYQLTHSRLAGLPSDPWAYYHEWKERDPRAAYLWLAQINKGQSLAQVRRWAQECLVQNSPWPVFESQKKWIQYLRSKKIRVFIVTASIKWAVEPCAALLGLHYDDVIGVETQVKNGIVTDELLGPITWKEGKAQALLDRTQGIAPLFCSGNTMGDLSLMESSQLLRLAVCSSQEGEELFETEISLQKIARENQWCFHSFKEKVPLI